MRRYIIITGIPASGKTTVGYSIAAALGLPMLDKDEILEAMFNSQGIGNAQWRRSLSRAADEVLRETALQSSGAVITSWWRHPNSHLDSGTPVEWLSLLQGIMIEIHCTCNPQVAAERFMSRRRHEGHLDNLKNHEEILISFQQQAALGSLGIEQVIEVSTEQTLELKQLIDQIYEIENRVVQ